MGPEGYNSATLFPMLKLKTLALDLDVLYAKNEYQCFLFFEVFCQYTYSLCFTCVCPVGPTLRDPNSMYLQNHASIRSNRFRLSILNSRLTLQFLSNFIFI
jgi:hypothetical protein